MTWSISASGDRLEVIETLGNAPIPTHLDRVNEQQHYSSCLDFVLSVLRASDKKLCSVSMSGWMDANGVCSATLSSLKCSDPEPAK